MSKMICSLFSASKVGGVGSGAGSGFAGGAGAGLQRPVNDAYNPHPSWGPNSLHHLPQAYLPTGYQVSPLGFGFTDKDPIMYLPKFRICGSPQKTCLSLHDRRFPDRRVSDFSVDFSLSVLAA